MNNAAKVFNFDDLRKIEQVTRYKELKAAQAELAKEEKELKAAIMAWLGDNSSAAVGDCTVVHKVTETQGLDTETLRKELPELWKEYGKTSKRHTLTIV